jgi:hypothetical protein
MDIVNIISLHTFISIKFRPSLIATPMDINANNIKSSVAQAASNINQSNVDMSNSDLGMFIKYLYKYVLQNLLRNVPYCYGHLNNLNMMMRMI